MDTNDSEGMEVEQIAEPGGLIFHDSVPELIKLTCFRLTLGLWSCSLQDPSDNLENTFKNKVDDLIKELNTKISSSTKNTITWYSRRILKLSSMWVTYHKKRVFKDWDIELIGGMCFPELIWRSDGSIDGIKSAEALIKTGMFGEKHEYKLVCLYCMEKKIVNMWARLADSECFVLDSFFDDDISLLSYWNSRMAGIFSESGLKSVESRLFANDVVDNLSASLYFFDRFTADERVEKGCQLIPCVKIDERVEYVKTILLKFNDRELRRAFQFHCSDIIYPLIMNQAYTKYSVEVWDHLNNTLTIQSFLSLMIRIAATVRTASKIRDRRFVNEVVDYDDFKLYIFASIADLWRRTPDSLRNHDLVSATHGVIFTLAEYFVRMKIEWDPEISFLFTIMSDASLLLRRRFIFKYFDKLSSMYRVAVVNRFRDVCYGRRARR